MKAVFLVLKLGLSVAAVCAVLVLVQFARVGLSGLGTDKPAMRAPSLPRSVSVAQVETFWPRYPGLKSEGAHASRLNGMPLVTEEGRVAGETEHMLAYYREQMMARGWADVTEEHFSLSPEARVGVEGREGLNDPDFVKRYEAVMDSNLVLRRGGWVLHIMMAADKDARATRVRLVAAQTPSLERFGLALSREILEGESGRRPREVLVAEEERGGTRFATRQLESGLTPDRFFNDLASGYRQEGWRLLFDRAGDGAGGRRFALFQRGASQLSLAVTPSRVGRGATALATEMTEAWRESVGESDGETRRVAADGGASGGRSPGVGARWVAKALGGPR